MLDNVPDGPEKQKQVAEYKRLLGVNYAKLAELELAILDEDEDLVDDTLDELKSIKKEAHTQFIEEN